MWPRIRGILFGTALFLILGEVIARPTEEQSLNLPKARERKSKTKHDAGKTKQTNLALRDSSRNQQHGGRRLRVSKPLKNSKALSPVKKYNKERKRQFIMRPLHALTHPYMFMRPPPMTQRTIVTTRIPRPPMAIPFNPYFPRSYFGGLHHHGSPFSYFDPMKMYSDEDEEEEGKCVFGCFDFSVQFVKKKGVVTYE